MSRSISTFELFALFPDQEAARVYLEGRLWPNGVTCPTCKTRESVAALTGKGKVGFYRCYPCQLDFTVRTGTVMERSKVPLHKWLYSMYLLVTARKGISSLQLSKEIGITQKSAWFVLHRLREACGGNLETLRGTIEIDESFFGGKEGNKHERDKLKAGRGSVGKTTVLGMRERGGRTLAMPIEGPTSEAIKGAIYTHCEPGSQLYSDDHAAYSDLDNLFFKHESVSHSAGEYVRGNASVNGIESVWAVMKRGIHGVYHSASKKHLHRYVDEFTFRLNEGNVKIHSLKRLDSFIDGTKGKRLTFKELTK